MLGHILGDNSQAGAVPGPGSLSRARNGVTSLDDRVTISAEAPKRRSAEAPKRRSAEAPSAGHPCVQTDGRIPAFRTHPVTVTSWAGTVKAAGRLPRTGTGATAPAP